MRKVAVFNSQSISIKIDVERDMASDYSQSQTKFNKNETKLKADALVALLVSANPLRSEYNFTDEDYIEIANMRKEADRLISQMKHFLKKRNNVIG